MYKRVPVKKKADTALSYKRLQWHVHTFFGPRGAQIYAHSIEIAIINHL